MRPLVAGGVVAGSVVGALAAGSALGAELVVRVEGVRSAAGTVNVAVCVRSFEERDCPYRAVGAARPGAVEFRLDVAPGRYAVAAYQDLNANGQFDRGGRGAPREPFGLSNGAAGIASFEGALVTVREPHETVVISLQ